MSETDLATDSRLRNRLDAGEFVAAPGIYDMFSAPITNKLGVDLIYGSGYWVTASCNGVPDAGTVL